VAVRCDVAERVPRARRCCKLPAQPSDQLAPSLTVWLDCRRDDARREPV